MWVLCWFKLNDSFTFHLKSQLFSHVSSRYNTSDKGMSCKKRGPWWGYTIPWSCVSSTVWATVVESHNKPFAFRHLGISKEACEYSWVCWFRTPCATLKECVDNPPMHGTIGHSRAFEDFAKDLVITDAHEKKQCRHAHEGNYQLSLNALSTVYFPHPTHCSHLQRLGLTRTTLMILMSAQHLTNRCVWVLYQSSCTFHIDTFVGSLPLNLLLIWCQYK